MEKYIDSFYQFLKIVNYVERIESHFWNYLKDGNPNFK